MVIDVIVVVMLQYMQISNHYVETNVMLLVNYTSVNKTKQKQLRQTCNNRNNQAEVIVTVQLWILTRLILQYIHMMNHMLYTWT